MGLPDDIAAAKQVAESVRVEREDLRRGAAPGDPDREATIEAALDSLTDAMKPIRRAMGQLQFKALEMAHDEESLREVSALLQYERKQLKKMRRP